MTIDLAGLSPSELTKLISQANAQMATARAKEIANAKSKIDAILRGAGLTIEDVFPRRGRAGRKPGKRAGAGVAKYRNPKNAEQTWSGMGKRPRWLADALASGARLEAFAISGLAVPQTAKREARMAASKTVTKRAATAKKARRK